jgi:sulfopyruvate decarboxylase subunit beta
MTDQHRIPLVPALKALHEVRGDAVVITAMGAAREWMTFGSHPLDFIYVPSSMGQAPTLGLGIALAQPNRQVIVCNGDGSMLMNFGSLVTITAHAPKNLTLLLFDNGVYEVTGAQPTPASPALRANGKGIDFVAAAKACGFESPRNFTELDGWKESVGDVIQSTGPTFARIGVAPVPEARGPRSPSPAANRATAFAAAIQSHESSSQETP